MAEIRHAAAGRGRRPDVLVLYPYYAPAYRSGGVVRNLENIAALVHDELRLRVVCGDTDVGGQPLPAGTTCGRWSGEGPVEVLRLPDRRAYRALFDLLRSTPADIWYLNSLFRLDFGLWPLLLRAARLVPRTAVLISVHGLLAASAMQVRSRRKHLYLRVLRRSGLLNRVVFHATDAREATDLRRHLDGARIVVAPNPVTAPPPAPVLSAPRDGPLRLVFLSRISPTKNLLGALEILARLDRPVCLEILGEIVDRDYWRRCRDAIAGLPSGVRVTHHGFVHPADVRRTISRCDALFLPTRGENFGHAIYEALACGLPVLIGENTPWTRVGPEGAGAALPAADTEGFRAVLRMWSDLSPERWSELRTAAHEVARRFHASVDFRRSYLDLFAQVMGSMPQKPDDRPPVA